MKTAFLALFIFAVSALATPLLTERQYETQADQIDKLTDLVKTHTANINKTTTAVPDTPSVAQQNAAAAALAPDFQAITNALTAAAANLPAAAARRAWEGLTNGGPAAYGHDCLLVKVQLLVWEVACTLKVVITKLGLACVLVYLQPLLLALVGLVKPLDKVVVGLLIVVKSLLTLVLGTVAGALLSLIF